jgi:alkanesulfonate monooxygenase SsuD/methylene tetrahydromethanopterin reductase-like flavin-dependent oxidoreductase (luciferase family)
MLFGVTLPHEEEPSTTVELACDAEAAGWDGVFLWDSISGNDPWVTLGAIAAKTERIKLATMLTPISRRRPWKLAQEAATLDRLSGGRFILPVGLGAPDTGFGTFGEEVERKTRAEMLDEGLDILDGLWSGEPFSYEGQHFQIQETTFFPLPVQRPRIPIWVVGAWPRMKSMRRVLRCDGIVPYKLDGTGEPVTPEDIRAIKAWLDENRAASTPFDILWEADTPGDDPSRGAAQVQEWAAAGVTWWLESVWDGPRSRSGLDGMRERILQGPPRG